LSGKLTTVRRVFHSGGARGIFAVLALKAASFMHAVRRRHLRRAIEVWCEREHWWLGLWVVCAGNVVRVDSCTFLVSHPAIRTGAKSLFLLGGYERAEREMLIAYLDRSVPVIELGGSLGVVACITNRLLKQPRRHVVVEANPDLISLLEGNRDRNGCAFTVVNRAIAYGKESTTFYIDGKDFLGSSVQIRTDRPIRVPTVTLGRIIAGFGIDVCTLVCDIEGGETDLVRHEPEVLQEYVAMIIIEVHGWRVGQRQGTETLHTLERIGFRCLHEKDGTYVFRNECLRVRTEAGIAH
jgi:FkbM family methyltransferase